MIIFHSEDSWKINYYERKLGKNRLKLLEKLLKKLGSFNPKEDINIINEEYIGDYDYIYEVKDSDGTSFKFYNYRLDYGKGVGRYSKNFYLTMQRKGSSLVYIYDFFKTKEWKKEPEVIEINSQLSESRVFRIEKNHGHFESLIVQENEKKYILGLNSLSSLLPSIEKISGHLQQIENLNLEELLNLVENRKNLFFANIYINGDLVASVDFQNGEIYQYNIVDSNQTFKTEETVTENYKRMQSDLKRLLKQL